jgi:quercetin dioxygenase-like cupin family protein
MELRRAGSQPLRKGRKDYSTGAVRIDPVFDAKAQGRVFAGSVTFEPGTRRTRPLGQYLIASAGFGWIQIEGGPIEEMRPGDVVWRPPGIRHWHGVSPSTSVTHLAIHEAFDGRNVVWREPVSDLQYRAGQGAAGAQ